MECKAAAAVALTAGEDGSQGAPSAASLCVNCRVRGPCVGSIAASAGTAPLRTLLVGRRALRAGEVLYLAGDPVLQVYAVRSGSLCSLADPAPHRVLGFHLPGELVGLDGLGSPRHRACVLALEDTQVCALRCGTGADGQGAAGALVGRLWDMASCELLRRRSLPGEGKGVQRLAGLLASLAGRMRGRGYGAGEFRLRMDAEHFASYAGLGTLEAERALEGFARAGWIEPCPGGWIVREPGALAEAAGRGAALSPPSRRGAGAPAR